MRPLLATAVRHQFLSGLEGSDDPVVFLLSAGWRTGSTLLQRMMMPQCFVWGEPYGHAWMVDSMAQVLRSFTSAWPESCFFHQGRDRRQLAGEFVANLYPPPQALLDAHLAFFDALFAKPALASGATRWGVKFVRLTADHAYYLRWIYPKAHFVFLTRNPYDAYRSYAARGVRWHNRWPDIPLNAREFGRHWAEATQSFLECAADLGALVVHYESLPDQVAEIEAHVGFPLAREAAEIRPGEEGIQRLSRIPHEDFAALHEAVKDAARLLEYSPNENETSEFFEGGKTVSLAESASESSVQGEHPENCPDAEPWLILARDGATRPLKTIAYSVLSMSAYREGLIEEGRAALRSAEGEFGLASFVELETRSDIDPNCLAAWLMLRKAREMNDSGAPHDPIEALLLFQRELVNRQPEDSFQMMHLGILYAWFNHPDERDAICASLLANAETTNDPIDWERAAKVGLIGPQAAIGTAERAVRASDMAMELGMRHPLADWFKMTAGLAAYRRRNEAEAEMLLASPSESENPAIRGPALVFRAMARHRAGFRNAAQEDFDRAGDQVCGPVPDRTRPTDAVLSPNDLFFWMAWEEACQLLGGNSPSGINASVQPSRPRSQNSSVSRLAAQFPWPTARPEVPIRKNEGWFHESVRDAFEELLNDRTSIVVELGSWLGLSTRFIAARAPNAVVIAIDHWKGSPEHHRREDLKDLLPVLYETFLTSCWDFKNQIIPVRLNSDDGLRTIRDYAIRPDLIYIDADHSFEAVYRDLKFVLEHFPSSAIVGDDWNWNGVRRAVEKVASESGRTAIVDRACWMLR